ncbi:MAG: hypothetical protein FWE69_00075 [Clostridiales bacterium]|nr:hypothetical protein [Clostridiales bacterium]
MSKQVNKRKRIKGKRLPAKPLRPLLESILVFWRGKLRTKYGLTVDREALRGVKPPFIVVFNHVGDDDQFVAGTALHPVMPNYMMSNWAEHSFPLAPLSKVAGAIHKIRFVPDVRAVMAAKRVLKERGGVVGVAPAASYSIDGTPSYFDYGIAKFCKMFKVPVFALRMDGLYFFHNRFSGRQLCRLHGAVTRVFDGPELKDMATEEVYKRLYEACDFNDFQYQRRVMAPVIAKDDNLAEGMEYVAYRCLRCGAEFQTEGKGNVLTCSACGNALRVNRYYFFEPHSSPCAWVEELNQWTQFQRQLVAEEIEKEDFHISCDCALYRFTEGKKYGVTRYGRGRLRLDASGFTYTGTDKDAGVTYHHPLADTYYVGNDTRVYLSVDTPKRSYQYRLDNMKMGAKYLLALTALREKYHPYFPDEAEWRRGLVTNTEFTIHNS